MHCGSLVSLRILWDCLVEETTYTLLDMVDAL